MPLVKRITTAYLFENGNLVVFDRGGQQVPELQGPYSIEKHKRIILESIDNCELKGFSILPSGFIGHANDIKYFRDKNISWDEIQEL